MPILTLADHRADALEHAGKSVRRRFVQQEVGQVGDGVAGRLGHQQFLQLADGAYRPLDDNGFPVASPRPSNLLKPGAGTQSELSQFVVSMLMRGVSRTT